MQNFLKNYPDFQIENIQSKTTEMSSGNNEELDVIRAITNHPKPFHRQTTIRLRQKNKKILLNSWKLAQPQRNWQRKTQILLFHLFESDFELWIPTISNNNTIEFQRVNKMSFYQLLPSYKPLSKECIANFWSKEQGPYFSLSDYEIERFFYSYRKNSISSTVKPFRYKLDLNIIKEFSLALQQDLEDELKKEKIICLRLSHFLPNSQSSRHLLELLAVANVTQLKIINDINTNNQKWIVAYKAMLETLNFARQGRKIEFEFDAFRFRDKPYMHNPPYSPFITQHIRQARESNFNTFPLPLLSDWNVSQIHFQNNPTLTFSGNWPHTVKEICVKSLSLNSLSPAWPEGLEYLELHHLDQLTNIADWSKLTSLDNLLISELDQLEVLPNYPKSLKQFDIWNCKKLKVLPDYPEHIEKIELGDLPTLTQLPNWSQNCRIKTLRLYELKQFKTLPEWPKSIKNIEISELSELATIPSFPSGVKYILLYKLPKLTRLPRLPDYLDSLSLRGLPVNIINTLDWPKHIHKLYLKSDSHPDLSSIQVDNLNLTPTKNSNLILNPSLLPNQLKILHLTISKENFLVLKDQLKHIKTEKLNIYFRKTNGSRDITIDATILPTNLKYLHCSGTSHSVIKQINNLEKTKIESISSLSPNIIIPDLPSTLKSLSIPISSLDNIKNPLEKFFRKNPCAEITLNQDLVNKDNYISIIDLKIASSKIETRINYNTVQSSGVGSPIAPMKTLEISKPHPIGSKQNTFSYRYMLDTKGDFINPLDYRQNIINSIECKNNALVLNHHYAENAFVKTPPFLEDNNNPNDTPLFASVKRMPTLLSKNDWLTLPTPPLDGQHYFHLSRPTFNLTNKYDTPPDTEYAYNLQTQQYCMRLKASSPVESVCGELSYTIYQKDSPPVDIPNESKQCAVKLPDNIEACLDTLCQEEKSLEHAVELLPTHAKAIINALFTLKNMTEQEEHKKQNAYTTFLDTLETHITAFSADRLANTRENGEKFISELENHPSFQDRSFPVLSFLAAEEISCRHRSTIYFILAHYAAQKLKLKDVPPIFLFLSSNHMMIDKQVTSESKVMKTLNLGGRSANSVYIDTVDKNSADNTEEPLILMRGDEHKGTDSLQQTTEADESLQLLTNYTAPEIRLSEDEPSPHWSSYQQTLLKEFNELDSSSACLDYLLTSAQQVSAAQVNGTHKKPILLALPPDITSKAFYNALCDHNPEKRIIYISEMSDIHELASNALQLNEEKETTTANKTQLSRLLEVDSSPIILVRWDKFSLEEQVRVKGILDRVPHLAGIKLPESVSLIHITENPGLTLATATQTRVKRLSWPNTHPLTTQATEEEVYQENVINHFQVINLHNDDAGWYDTLVEKFSLKDSTIKIEPSPLRQVISCAKNHPNEIATLTLTGCPNTLTFNNFLMQLQAGCHSQGSSRFIHLKHEWVELPKNIRIKVDKEPSQLELPASFEVITINRLLDLNDNDETAPYFYVNANNAKTLYKGLIVTDKGVDYSAEASVLCKETIQGLVITENLPLSTWERLIHFCNTTQQLKNTSLKLCVLNDVELPDFVEQRITQTVPSSLPDEAKANNPNHLHVHEDTHLFSERHRLNADEQKQDQQIVYINEETTFDRLFLSLKLNRETNGVNRGFQVEKTALFNTLQMGNKSVLLVGKPSAALLQSISPWLIGQPVYFNGKFMPIKGTLSLVMPPENDDIYLKACPCFEGLGYKAAQKQGRYRSLQEQFDDYKKTFEMENKLSNENEIKQLNDFLSYVDNRQEKNILNYSRWKAIAQTILQTTQPVRDNPLKPYLLGIHEAGTVAYAELNVLTKVIFSKKKSSYVRQKALLSLPLKMQNIWKVANTFSAAALRKLCDIKENDTVPVIVEKLNQLNDSNSDTFKKLQEWITLAKSPQSEDQNEDNTVPFVLKAPDENTYKKRNKRALLDLLKKRGIVFLQGPPGVGKTYAMQQTLKSGALGGQTIDVHTVLNQNTQAIIDFLTNSNRAMLVLDEGNIEPNGTWDFLRPLWERRHAESVTIYYQGKDYHITNPKEKYIVVTGNPDNYPQVNHHTAFDGIPRERFKLSIAEKQAILEKTLFTDEQKNSTINKETKEEICSLLLASFCSIEALLPPGRVSLRNIRHMAILYRDRLTALGRDVAQGLDPAILAAVFWDHLSGLCFTAYERQGLSKIISEKILISHEPYTPTYILPKAIKHLPHWYATSNYWEYLQYLLSEFIDGSGLHKMFLLEGPAGVGKSTLASDLFTQHGYRCFKSIDELMTTEQLNEKAFIHLEEPHMRAILKAVEIGCAIIVDEINIFPEAIKTLLKILDGECESIDDSDIDAKTGKNRLIKTHPNFKAIFTQNPATYEARAEDSLAILNRGTKYIVRDYNKTELTKLTELLRPDLPSSVINDLVRSFPQNNTNRDFIPYISGYQRTWELTEKMPHTRHRLIPNTNKEEEKAVLDINSDDDPQPVDQPLFINLNIQLNILRTLAAGASIYWLIMFGFTPSSGIILLPFIVSLSIIVISLACVFLGITICCQNTAAQENTALDTQENGNTMPIIIQQQPQSDTLIHLMASQDVNSQNEEYTTTAASHGSRRLRCELTPSSTHPITP